MLLLRRHDEVAPADELLPRHVLGQIGGEEDALDPVDLVDPFRKIIGKAEPLADFVEDPEVGFRFPEGLDGGRLEDDDAMIELLLAVMAVTAERRPFADVDPLEIGAGRQDDVGEFGVALHPDRLRHDEFQVLRLEHLHVAMGVVHRGDQRAAIFVHHAHRRMAGRRIAELLELRLDRLAVPRIAFRLALENRLGEIDARNLLQRRVHGRQLRHALIQLDRERGRFEIARHAAIGIAGEIEIEVDRGAPLQVPHIDAGLAQSLHRDEAHHRARPLDAGLVAAGAAMAVAPAAAGEISALLCPFARERAHVLGRNAGLLLLPFRRFRRPVLLAHDIGLPRVEADGVGRDIVFVVQAFVDPHIGDRERERGRGGRLRTQPFAGEELGRRIEIGIDVDELDPELLQPLPADGAFLRAVGAAGRVRIGRPEHHHLAVLQQVLDRAVSLALADAQRVAPVMRRAPVPALPAVGIVVHGRVADRVAEAEQAAQVIADMAPGMVRSVRDGHRARTVVVLHALDLVCDGVERLVPTDADIARLAAVLRIARALGIEVDRLSGYSSRSGE